MRQKNHQVRYVVTFLGPKGEHCMQKHLYEHFTLPGNSVFLQDVSVTLIDKTDPSCPTKREDYWIDTTHDSEL